jgi:hypothetical protein
MPKKFSGLYCTACYVTLHCLIVEIFLCDIKTKRSDEPDIAGNATWENAEMEKGFNYRQQVGTCDRLLAMAAVKLRMFIEIGHS